MSNHYVFPRSNRRTARRWFTICCLAALFALALSTAALAADPSSCASCHSPEARTWDMSPHAKRGVACEACHGEYVENHAETGAMQLDASSHVCEYCHQKTYTDWQTSGHAQAGVQCIGCHLSHSQGLRLPGKALCLSCHDGDIEGAFHADHQAAACADCHVSEVEEGAADAFSHDFRAISTACVDCHAEAVTRTVLQKEEQAALEATDPARVLAKQLADVEASNESLQSMTVVSLGLGLGIGGVLGIVFTLVVFYIVQGRQRRWTR